MTTRQNILVLAHTGRTDSIVAAIEVVARLRADGATPVCTPSEYTDIREFSPDFAPVALLGQDVAVEDLELVIVLGGDGTILRAAELVRGYTVPLLGVNLGHVGFLAESERDHLPSAVQRVVSRDYLVEERLTLAVSVVEDGTVVYETWALNEATVEKASRQRMLEVVTAVDQRPLSSFGCDGVVFSTPTGSTAYAFSAGGPVIWPTVEALTMVPLSAHALFARPLVVAPDSTLTLKLLDRSQARAVLWADGRRTFDLSPGAQVVVARSPLPVRLARLHDGSFTDRLVHKFHLPTTGWRGSSVGD